MTSETKIQECDNGHTKVLVSTIFLLFVDYFSCFVFSPLFPVFGLLAFLFIFIFDQKFSTFGQAKRASGRWRTPTKVFEFVKLIL